MTLLSSPNITAFGCVFFGIWIHTDSMALAVAAIGAVYALMPNKDGDDDE